MELEEEWRDIPGYSGDYQVSNLGRVRSYKRLVPIIMSTKTKEGFYEKVSLYKKGVLKVYLVHQLVAMAFLNHIPNGHTLVVDHIDNNMKNNNLYNLQVITVRENSSKDKRDKSSPFTGVTKRNNRYEAHIHTKKGFIYLGTFDSEKEASTYYKNALKSYNKGEKIKVKRHEYSSRHKGVAKVKDKWTSYIFNEGKNINLGKFNTEDEALLYRQNAEKSIKEGREIVIKRFEYSSQYKGIKFSKKYNKWYATLKGTHLGTFDTELEAYLFYKKAVIKLSQDGEIPIKKKKYSSKYKGVSYHKKNKKWIAVHKKNYIGSYETEDLAFLAILNYLNSLNKTKHD